MKAVTIKEAKAKLNALVDAASKGEQVVLMRGARHVAAIVPISADDLELASSLSDEQAARFWRSIVAERTAGTMPSFTNEVDAVVHLANRVGRRAAATRRSRSRRIPDR